MCPYRFLVYYKIKTLKSIHQLFFFFFLTERCSFCICLTFPHNWIGVTHCLLEYCTGHRMLVYPPMVMLILVAMSKCCPISPYYNDNSSWQISSWVNINWCSHLMQACLWCITVIKSWFSRSSTPCTFESAFCILM